MEEDQLDFLVSLFLLVNGDISMFVELVFVVDDLMLGMVFVVFYGQFLFVGVEIVFDLVKEQYMGIILGIVLCSVCYWEEDGMVKDYFFCLSGDDV